MQIHGVRMTLAIPAGAFPASAQITLTAPDATPAGSAGGYNAVAGAGVQVQENGSAYTGAFRKALTLTMRSPSITSSSVVVVWNGKDFVTDKDATITPGAATVSFATDPDFAALSPAVTRTPSRGVTGPVTGDPFTGGGILAGALIPLGAIGLAVG